MKNKNPRTQKTQEEVAAKVRHDLDIYWMMIGDDE